MAEPSDGRSRGGALAHAEWVRSSRTDLENSDGLVVYREYAAGSASMVGSPVVEKAFDE